jgi:tRNA 2-selenouridine synthase
MATTKRKTTVPTIRAEEALALEGATFVDLRSPGEFAQDHVPGAANVPLFDDTERAVIGTLYSRHSPEIAFEEGRARTRERIEALVGEVAALAGWEPPAVDLAADVDRLTSEGLEGLDGSLELEPVSAAPERPVVLGCWRGGLRSRSVVALLVQLGLDRALCLEGGYRAYRSEVRERIAAWRAPETFVLRGLTGVGKTLVLRAIEALRPGWTLDLEALAGHRSSILGMVGLEPCSQKTFESRLRARLDAGFPGPCLVEGESRKVGDVILPVTVWEALRAGTDLQLVASKEARVRVLIDDYLAREENRAHLARQLPFVEERLGSTRYGGVLVGLLNERREAELVELLLERYYDPLYAHSEKDHRYVARFDAEDPEAAARAVVEWVEARSRHL